MTLQLDAGALQQRNRELSILNTIAQALNATLALDSALQTTLAHLAELFGLETGWVWLLDEPGYLWHEFGDLHLMLP